MKIFPFIISCFSLLLCQFSSVSFFQYSDTILILSFLQKIYRSFMMNMRCLLHKNILQPTDLSYPIELCRKGTSGESSLVSHLMRDLALLFLIRADASHYILREIFSIVRTTFYLHLLFGNVRFQLQDSSLTGYMLLLN